MTSWSIGPLTYKRTRTAPLITEASIPSERWSDRRRPITTKKTAAPIEFGNPNARHRLRLEIGNPVGGA